jgi:hypothetical protein
MTNMKMKITDTQANTTTMIRDVIGIFRKDFFI